MEKVSKEELDKELHRITITTLVYKPDFTYLITRRAMHKSHPGKWTIPGGGLTTDDYIHLPPSTQGAKQWYNILEKTIKREMKEEVNLEVGKTEFLTDLTFIRADGIPVIVFSYFTPFISGEVKMDKDTIDFAWVTLEEARNYDLIDGIWDEIREVDEILKKAKK
jgi:8-oxo-dGTP pyrophosphatase MutT (NUDIX family)